MDPLPVNILCGYLGAGKTTLLNHLLAASRERILVMVNDFGAIAVDASLIAAKSEDTIQMSNGCICCTMGADLFSAFERVFALRTSIDRLVIEASGVAEPQRLSALARAEPDLDCRAVLAVADPLTLAARLADPRVGRVLAAQIEGADALYLSRADIAPEALAPARELALGLNAALVTMSDPHVVPDALALPHRTAPRVALSILFPDAPHPHEHIFARREISRSAPARAALLDCLRAEAASLHRLKGFLTTKDRTEIIQIAGGVLSVTASQQGYQPGLHLVAIDPSAPRLDALALRLMALTPG